MAWASTTIAAGELAALAADRMILVGNNVLESYNALPEWRTSGVLSSGTDITASVYPTSFGFDRGASVRTKPTYSAGWTEVSYVCNLSGGSTDVLSADTAVVWGHNFSELGGNLAITLDIANASDFGASQGTATDAPASFRTLAQWNNPTTSARLYSLSLNGLGLLSDQRYTSIQYLRLRIRKTSGTFSTAPEFGELWLGRRRQLPYFPDVPWSEETYMSDVADHRSISGVITRYVRNRGGRLFDLALTMAGADPTYSIDPYTQLKSWWSECGYGSKASLLFLRPYSTTEVHVVYPEAKLEIPRQGPYERTTTLALSETAPFMSSEV